VPAPSLDARVQDLVAVMRVEDVQRAVICGFSEGGTMAAFFASTYPERTEGLILCGSFARLRAPRRPSLGANATTPLARFVDLGYGLSLG
jgi:pimeloyl-ACP methyl ester carboxylesterase